MIGATPATDQQTNSLPGIYSASSKAWIQRQKKDPFVKKSREEGFASRASFKILQVGVRTKLCTLIIITIPKILEKETFMKEIHSGETPFRIIDLGAAPGSWSQALSRHFNTLGSKFEIIALDKQGTDCISSWGISWILLTSAWPSFRSLDLPAPRSEVPEGRLYRIHYPEATGKIIAIPNRRSSCQWHGASCFWGQTTWSWSVSKSERGGVPLRNETFKAGGNIRLETFSRKPW